MKQLTALFFLCAIFFACKDEAKKEKKFDAVSYEKAKETLAEKEKNNPVKFIHVDNRDRKNLIGQTVVIGHLTNNATVCTYKDVDLKLSFFSKTGVKLDEGIETIYETIAPGKTIKFKTKYFTPKGTDSVFVAVVKATGEVPDVK
jgi:N12 class adenine-specific DNA methylase